MGEGEHHQVYKMADEQNDADFEVNTGDAGASLTVSVEAGQIRKGGYIFTGATCEELCPSTHSIDVPVVTKSDWQIQGLQDETYVLLMNDDGDMREDLQTPDQEYKTDDDVNTSKLIKEYVEAVDGGAEIEIYCTVLSAIGKEKIIDVRKKDQ